uniref:Histidine--tRNA ligase, chloroplastic n=1 Tax=Corynoplastis japonica TaxID=700918 RepID=A0A1X9PTQ3_9RHOD|nr:histidine tRNA synthetase [Corynoplastis japonica]
MSSIQSLRGTKDIFSNDIGYWHLIEKTAREVFHTINYQEIRTPVLENSDLFERGIGLSTDIINKEIYSFIDKGNRSIALRPEGTASIARAFIQNKLYGLNLINKLWYLGPMFRYERPQGGRQRQFHQLGVEVIGSSNPLVDVEVISLATKMLNQLNISNYCKEINSLGTLEERQKYKNSLVQYLLPYKYDLDNDSQSRLKSNPIRILDTKDNKTLEIISHAPNINQYLGLESRAHMEEICNCLAELNISFQLNPKLVRGLDYYNNTAFEIKTSELGAQDTICGGGRYDNLIKQLGGPETPAVGWAIGIERLLIILKNQINLEINQVDFYIISDSKKTQLESIKLAELLREKGYSVEVDLSNKNFSKQIKRANQYNSIACIIFGETEFINNNFQVKWLKDYLQESFSISEINILVSQLNKRKLNLNT